MKRLLLIFALLVVPAIGAGIWAVSFDRYPRTCPIWETMDTAPRDGTIIEICQQAAMPVYSLRKWTDMIGGKDIEGIPVEPFQYEKLVWYDPARTSWYDSGVEPTMVWRRTDQKPETYVDPTNGAQWTDEYWRVW